MSIIIRDPLGFITAQGGIVGTPLVEAGASGADDLDSQQRNAVIGEPIPIVFCRRVDGVGGALVSPAATEARFEDDASSNITASYHLVLSEGQIDSIQVRDVFQRSCRVGSFSQTYGRRAGTFIPGNFIDNTPNLEAPGYCGTSGTYEGLSTMAFSVTIPEGFDQWNRQVHCFVRGGIYIPRLIDSVTGPSNNVADLLLYLFRNSSRVPEVMIDTAASFLTAATFTNANGLFFNGVVNESTNLRDWIDNTLQYFLLRQARINGKEALRPLVPINSNGTIKTTAVSWVFAFTEEHIIPDSFEISYTSLADRKPFCATIMWRQQDDLGIPVMRTTEVRYTGTAVDGPFEQHDLTGFCASENHAVKAGAYIISKRRHVTHRLQLGVKPDAFNPTLTSGDLVRVRLERVASTGGNSVHDYLYEVDRIGKSISGEVQLELTHFPIDDTFASVVAKEVNAAVGASFILPTGLTGVTCDINSFNDTTIPPDISLDPSAWNLPADESFNVGVIELDDTDLNDMPQLSIDNLALDGIGGLGGFGGGGGRNAAENNPAGGGDNQGLDGQINDGRSVAPANDDGNYIGQTWTLEDCPAGCSIQWLRNGQPISSATNASYTTTIEDAGSDIAVQCCGQEVPGSFEAGTDPLPPPAAGTNPNVKLYWILGNVFCLDNGCTQGKTINGFVTVSYSFFNNNTRFASSAPYPQVVCLFPAGVPCGTPVPDPQNCDDLAGCTLTRDVGDIQFLISGTWVNQQSYVSDGLSPRFVAVYDS